MSFIEQSHRKDGILALMLLSLFWPLTASAQAPAQTPVNQPPADNTYIEGAVLWQQTSGEWRALSYQSFALARMLLDRDLRVNRRTRKPRAIIVDLDETILDNSRNEGMMVKNRINFNQKDWTNWVNRAEAEAVPGAVEFLRYAASRGVTVFYITNRNESQKAGTAENLKNLGFPPVTNQTLLIQTDPKDLSKESRRQTVGAKYRVVLLMGDDLNDFAAVFEKSKTVESRVEAAERNRDQFGSRFIMLPNPMYGNWETAIYGYGSKLSEAEKAEKRKSALKGY
jgi:5'-nucleotidase (lipoprotein e(P4) family)